MTYASRTRELLAIAILVGASGVAGCESESETTTSSDGTTETRETLKSWKWRSAHTWEDLIDPFTILNAEVDGKVIHDMAQYRARSGLVRFKADISWQPLGPCVNGKPQKAVAAGFDLMLKPLSPGAHDIHFHAEHPGCAIDVSYHLDVEKPRKHAHGYDEDDGGYGDPTEPVDEPDGAEVEDDTTDAPGTSLTVTETAD